MACRPPPSRWCDSRSRSYSDASPSAGHAGRLRRDPGGGERRQGCVAESSRRFWSPDALRTLIDNGRARPAAHCAQRLARWLRPGAGPLDADRRRTVKKNPARVVDTLGDVLDRARQLLPIPRVAHWRARSWSAELRAHAGPLAAGRRPPAVCARQPVQADDPRVCGAVEARVKKSGGAPVADVRCTLNHFDLNLLGDNAASSSSTSRRSSSPSTPRPRPTMSTWFLGHQASSACSSFVETLRDLIPLDGFSDPPDLTVDAQGIDASFSVALPNLAVGVIEPHQPEPRGRLHRAVHRPAALGALQLLHARGAVQPDGLAVRRRRLLRHHDRSARRADPGGRRSSSAPPSPSTSGSPAAACTSWPASTSRWSPTRPR